MPPRLPLLSDEEFRREAPLGLRVAADTSLHLLLPDGNYVRFLNANVTLRVLAVPQEQSSADDTLPGGFLLSDDDDFVPHVFDEIRAMPSACGMYVQAQYAVLTDDGYPLDVCVDWDETDHLRVTVNFQINKEVLPKVSPTPTMYFGRFSTD
jgi:hypothetical protein